MAQHNWVVHRLALHHRRHGDNVYADHCKGYRKPPIYAGTRGGRYRPDVWIPTDGLVYEVEPYLAVERALPQINAFASDDVWHDMLSGLRYELIAKWPVSGPPD